MYNLIVDEKIILESNGEILEQYDYNENSIEGNIYFAKVKDVVKGMESSFVDIGREKNALLRNNNYKANTDLIVQVKKEETSKKGAIVTDKIQISGKYIILLPTEKFVSVSQKIENEEEQKRLKHLVETHLNGFGAIIRTSAENEEEQIIVEIKELLEKWNSIQSKAENVPSLLHKEDALAKILKGLTDKNISKIITTKKERVKEVLEKLELDILIEEAKTNFKAEDLTKKQVWLKSGGFIVIEQTEALVSIDVNSGSYTGKEDFETTAEKINKEAAIEISKQIRLRNLRGIIVVDYINLKNEMVKKEIVELMKIESKKDRSKVEIYGFTELGLLEITRKQL